MTYPRPPKINKYRWTWKNFALNSTEMSFVSIYILQNSIKPNTRILYFAKLAEFCISLFRGYALIKIFHNRDSKSEQRRKIKALYVGRGKSQYTKLVRGIRSYRIEYEAWKQNRSWKNVLLEKLLPVRMIWIDGKHWVINLQSIKNIIPRLAQNGSYCKTCKTMKRKMKLKKIPTHSHVELHNASY